MKLSGFTIARNIEKYDYPALESIQSILPICDEFIVVVGDSDDHTLELIQSIPDNKIKIIETIWDPALRTGGQVLSQQTNIALSHCSGDWCFYIQGDEVLHEKYLPVIRPACERYLHHHHVDGFLFAFLHFWGNYNYYGTSRRWYRHEIRIIRNLPSITSYKDAQGFRINNQKLKVIILPACMYHYGWVRPPALQQAKQRFFHSLWHSDKWITDKLSTESEFDYTDIDGLASFTGTHPHVLQERIQHADWEFHYQPSRIKMTLKNRLLHAIEQVTGYRLGEYKNYLLLKNV